MAVIDFDAPISRAAFAGLVGISEQRVGTLVRGGVIAEGSTAREQLWAYAAHLRAMAAGRASGGLNLAEERAHLARVHRELAELKLAEETGELVRAAAVEREVAGRLVALRDALETVGNRIGAILAAESDAASCARITRDEIRAALAAFTQETEQ